MLKLMLIFACFSCTVATQVLVRETRANCIPKINLKCDKTLEKRFTYYVYHQHSDITPGCKANKITNIQWSLVPTKGGATKNFPEASNKRVLTLPARIVPMGTYTLKVTATETGGQQSTASCKVYYVSEPPVLIFSHGYSQNIFVGGVFSVDIRNSNHYGNKLPPVSWELKCIKNKKNKQVCKSIKCEVLTMRGLSFTGITSMCFDSFIFTATVQHDNRNISAEHRVNSRKAFSCSVDIVCEKNCDKAGASKSNPQVPIVLKLKTSNKYCQGFEKWKPTWEIIKPGGIRLGKDQLTLVNDNIRAIVKENVFAYSDDAVVVSQEPEKFETWFQINIIPAIGTPKCAVVPKSGTSLLTKFSITCKSDDDYLDQYGPYYYVYQNVGGKKHLLTSSADDTFEVLVASVKGQPEQTLEIQGRDLFYNAFQCDVNPITVKEVKVNEKKIASVLQKMSDAYRDGDPLGMQYAGGLLIEMKQNKLEAKVVKEAHKKMMTGLSNFKINSMDVYDQVAGLTPSFIEYDKMNVNYKKDLAKLCKKLSTVHVQELHKSIYVKYQEMEAKKQANITTDCADKLLEKVKEDEEEVEVTTAKKIPEEELPMAEDYPDYVLPFGNPDIEEIKLAGMDITTNSARAIATTLSAGEEYVHETKTSTSLISNEEGKYMSNKRLSVGTATLIPSADFKDEGANTITAIISNYDKDVLTPRSQLSSDVVDIHFFNNTDQMKDVAYDIEFEILEDQVEFEAFVVKQPTAARTWQEIDKKMNVHRIQLLALDSVLIRFQLDGNSIKLNVAMSVNERPRKRHFNTKEINFVVDSNDTSTWAIQNTFPRSETDAFFYVAVIPHPDMLRDYESVDVNYKIQLTSVACVLYNKDNHQWNPSGACDPYVRGTDNDTLVVCTCKVSSLHSVLFKPIDHRLDEQMLIDYTVTDFVNYIVFIHVVIILIVYIIGLALILKRKAKVFGKDKIFFLSDNLKNDRYCYMLVVRTGSYVDSGTTANIMIQVFGTVGKSKCHVLNYPDPACKLLQRDSVDWLILAHSAHLGDLNSILLWTDSIGLYPTWYCEDITIFDLQTRKKYLFIVHTWLSALVKHIHYIRIAKSSEDEASKIKIGKNLSKHFRFHLTGIHTWNFFVRDDEDITYAERLTVILSTIYTTYMVTIWLIGQPTLTRADSFGYGRFRFDWPHVTFSIVTSIVASAIHLPIVYFFRNSKITEQSTAMVLAIKRFPFKVRKVLWYVLTSWICVCFLYLVTFGFWITYNSVYTWICVTIFALLISITIWENLFIIIVNIINSHKGIAIELVYRFDAIIKEIERQREILFRKFGEVLMRPYFKKHYRLLTPFEIHNLREHIATRQNVARLFKDMCLFVIYIGILYIICIMQYDDTIYKCNKMMRLMVEESIYADRKYKLEDIESMKDVFDYVEFVIIPTVHPSQWYGKWYALEPGLMADFSTKILGVVQLRQQRRTQKCEVPYAMKTLQIPCINYAPVFDDWEFYDGAEITSTIGRLQIYDGSGYIARLGRTLNNSKTIVGLLRKHKWIDINSAVALIEFLTYNANLNMFNAVRVIIERSQSGRLIKSVQIHTLSLIYSNLTKEIMVVTLLILFTIVIIIMSTKRLVEILIHRGNYLKSFWNILDLILTCLSIVLIVLFFVKKRATFKLLKEIVDTDHNQFIHYFYLITLSQTGTIIYAITLSLATLRLWKFLHFGILFRIMERTILKSAPQFIGLFICQVLVYLMMAVFVYPLYSDNLIYFRDFYTSLVTLYLASINFHEHLDNIYMIVNKTSLYLVYSLFLLISLCFLNLYATTLMLNLDESRLYYSNRTSMYSIQNYVYDVAYFYREKLRKHLESTRLKGGGTEPFEVDVDTLIYPKAEVHRYADLIHMNKRKMQLMKYISIAAIRNIRKYGRRNDVTEDEFSLMALIVINLFSTKDDNVDRFAHMFFKAKDPVTGNYKFVPDTKMLQMEMVVKKLLQGKTEEIKMEPEEDVVIHTSGDAERLDYLLKCLELVQSTLQNIVVVGK